MGLRFVDWMVAAAVLLGGCGLSLSDVEAVQNTCSTDADCPHGACEPETGMCIATSSEPLRVGLTVSPASTASSSVQTVAFDATEVMSSTVRDLTMPASIRVRGRVLSDDTGESVPAQVRFVRPAVFPGGSPTEVTATTSGGEYQVRVTAGEAYDVIVEPTGDAVRAFPPLYLEDVAVPADAEEHELDLRYPQELPYLEGRLFSQVGDEEVAENGLQVRAVAVADGRRVSSTAVTGTTATSTADEDGAFTVHLTPGAELFVLQVTGGSERPLFPTLTIDPALVPPGTVEVTRLEPVRYEGLVEARTPSGAGPVPNAVVTLRSEDLYGDQEEVTGTFRAMATTDGEGRFSVEVLPGTYDVVIAPPGAFESSSGTVASELGVLVEAGVRIEAGNDTIRGQLFTVSPREQVGGYVETADGRPVGGAAVQASALGMLLPAVPASPYNRSSDTVTDGNGLFDLRVDAGAYDLSIKPPSGSGFPWLVHPGWWVGTGEAPEVTAFTMPAPVPLRGSVMAADGTPLAGAEVRAHGVVEDPDRTLRTVPLGRAIVAEDGSYELLLAPRP
ncbi:MAG: carboxypeptidase-like regulatory domain-containing protein [Myxococcota bacterium]